MSLPTFRIDTYRDDGEYTVSSTTVYLVLEDGTEVEMPTTRIEKLADVNGVKITVLGRSNLPIGRSWTLDVDEQNARDKADS